MGTWVEWWPRFVGIQCIAYLGFFSVLYWMAGGERGKRGQVLFGSAVFVGGRDVSMQRKNFNRICVFLWAGDSGYSGGCNGVNIGARDGEWPHGSARESMGLSNLVFASRRLPGWVSGFLTRDGVISESKSIRGCITVCGYGGFVEIYANRFRMKPIPSTYLSFVLSRRRNDREVKWDLTFLCHSFILWLVFSEEITVLWLLVAVPTFIQTFVAIETLLTK